MGSRAKSGTTPRKKMSVHARQGTGATFSLSPESSSRKPRTKKSSKESSNPYQQGNLFETVRECEVAPGRSNSSPGRTEASPGRTKKTANGRRRKPELMGDTAPYLQIESTPLKERIDPSRHTYILIILPQGVRAAGGEYSAEEAYEIAQATKGWDWSLNSEGRPVCLGRLEALLDNIIRRLAKQGEVD